MSPKLLALRFVAGRLPFSHRLSLYVPLKRLHHAKLTRLVWHGTSILVRLRNGPEFKWGGKHISRSHTESRWLTVMTGGLAISYCIPNFFRSDNHLYNSPSAWITKVRTESYHEQGFNKLNSFRWLFAHDQKDESVRVISRLLDCNENDACVERTITEMDAALLLEQRNPKFTLKSLFNDNKSEIKPTRRLALCFLVQFFQMWTGINVIAFYGTATL